MEIEIIKGNFSICKLNNIENLSFNNEFTFLAKTDNEISLVCRDEFIPKNCIECELGFKCFRIKGIIDFSVLGLIAKISKILFENKIVIFVISTFNTDYIFVKNKDFEKAISLIKEI